MKTKKKIKRSRTKSNLFFNMVFTFYKYRDINYFIANQSPNAKRNQLKDFKDKLELFYYDTEEN